jgi:TldD protein
MVTLTRRDFVATTSASLLGGSVFGRSASGQYGERTQVSRGRVSPSSVAADYLPSTFQASDLQQLAQRAVDAAMRRGASYADIRVAEQHLLEVKPNFSAEVSLISTFTYGIRVIVDGAWAFTHGTIPSIDAMTAAAADAVTAGRACAPFVQRRVQRAPSSPARGEWASPMVVDPFTVPFENQNGLLNALVSASGRVRHGGAGSPRFEWTRETRVFASSEGALTTQHLRRSYPRYAAYAGEGMGGVSIRLPRFSASSGGYEVVMSPSWQDEIVRVTHEAAEFASLPRRPIDVGRYPVVFDGKTCATALNLFAGCALEADRALENEMDTTPPSIFFPPEEWLGNAMASPLLNVTANRAVPAFNAVRWDDEGVECREYPVVTDGKLMSYHTSRQTAAELSEITSSASQSPQSRGCAVAPTAADPVWVRSTHLTMTPASGASTLSDLCKDMKHGIIVRNAEYLNSDPKFASGELASNSVSLLEVERGKIVRRVVGNRLQLTARPFWRSLVALGDATTVAQSVLEAEKGQPWRRVVQTAAAPAALFKEINVIGDTFWYRFS